MTGGRALPRILVVHNRYQQAGGEDGVFAHEVAMLRDAGCVVETVEVSNDDIRGALAQASAAIGVIANAAGRRIVAEAIARTNPDIVHVHNFFPRLSPALFDACASAGVPAVWTLHNYRYTCASAVLFREGRPCEDCLGKPPLPAIAHRCYRGSLAGSAAVAAMIGYHRARGTWRHKVARFIALTESGRDIATRAGLPAARIAVKPNFVPDPLDEIVPPGAPRAGAVFAGRLSPEKGVATLIEAWRALPHIPLTIIGDGPERAALETGAPAHVTFAGFRQRPEALRAIAGAQALIVPSIWYETFGLVAAEAMALGTPVIASRIGALATLVTDDVDGLHVTPGDAADLARVAGAAFAAPETLERLGRAGRQTWHATMRPETNLTQLLAIYDEARAA